MTIQITRGSDLDAVAWRQAVAGAGGTVSGGQFRRVATLVRALKAQGVWPALDRLHVVGETFTQFNTDLMKRATGTNHGAIYTNGSGIKGNGSSTYWDSGFNTSTGTNFTQHSGHFGVWQNVAKTTGAAGNHGNVNTDAGTNGTFTDFSAGAGLAATRVNSSNGAPQTVTAGIGFLLANRTNSIVQNAWYNGAKGATETSTDQAPQNLTLWIGGRNFVGSINQASDAQVCFFVVGGGLSDAQALALYNVLSAFKTAAAIP